MRFVGYQVYRDRREDDLDQIHELALTEDGRVFHRFGSWFGEPSPWLERGTRPPVPKPRQEGEK